MSSTILRKLVSLSSLIVCGLSLTTMACSSAPVSSLDVPSEREDRDDDDDTKTSSKPRDTERDTSRPAADRSLAIDVDSEVRLDPGETVRLDVVLERGKDLTESGTITLTGLPDGFTAEPISVREEATHVQVVVTADKNVRAGRTNATVRAKVGSVEKTAAVNFVVNEDGAGTQQWCAQLSQCCDDMPSTTEQLICLANAGFLNDQNACKVHLVAYIAKGDCSINVR